MASSIPTIVFTCLAVLMSILRKYKPFRDWASSLLETSLSDYFLPSKQAIVATPEFKVGKPSNRFKGTKGITLYELTQSLTQLREYFARAQRQNGVIFNRANELNEESLEQLREISYFTKIQKVNKSIEENNKALEAVIKHVLDKLVKCNIADSEDETLPDQLKTICADIGYHLNENNELSFTGDAVILSNSKSNQGSVNEAIGHLCRDWSANFECERQPINDFVHERITERVNISNESKTLVVVPGAGVGQLPFFIAKSFPHCQVDSVEWSSLMYIFNEFALGHGQDVRIRPFAQHYSGSLDTQSQIRSFEVPLSKIKRPANLASYWGDFRQYTTNTEHYDQIIVCTAFFIDTAENVFEYLEAIEQLSAHCKTLHWINVGPLKYGTRPLVQFTADELERLRKVRGWKDLVETRTTDYREGLNGYLTNTESLYQGYYGLLKFHTVFDKTSN